VVEPQLRKCDGCGQILIDTYLKIGQIRSNCCVTCGRDCGILCVCVLYLLLSKWDWLGGVGGVIVKWCWRKWCRGHGSGVDCGKILIETYLKGDQIRLDCGGSGDRSCGIDAGNWYLLLLSNGDWLGGDVVRRWLAGRWSDKFLMGFTFGVEQILCRTWKWMREVLGLNG
jgi:hypothetical protein